MKVATCFGIKMKAKTVCGATVLLSAVGSQQKYYNSQAIPKQIPKSVQYSVQYLLRIISLENILVYSTRFEVQSNLVFLDVLPSRASRHGPSLQHISEEMTITVDKIGTIHFCGTERSIELSMTSRNIATVKASDHIRRYSQDSIIISIPFS